MAKHYFYPPDLKIIERQCRICSLLLPIGDYALNKTHTSGYQTACKTCFNKREAGRYKVKSEAIKKQALTYYYNNKPKVRESKRKRQKIRLQTDEVFKLTRNLRNRLYCLLIQNTNIEKLKFKNYVGCTGQELKAHIENLFDINMNWDNYGTYWEVDHIKPLSKFESTDDLYARCHFTNLQPLKISINRMKSNK